MVFVKIRATLERLKIEANRVSMNMLLDREKLANVCCAGKEVRKSTNQILCNNVIEILSHYDIFSGSLDGSRNPFPQVEKGRD